jgi:integrase
MSYVQVGDWQVFDPGGNRKYLNEVEGEHFLFEADFLDPAKCAFCYVMAFTGCRVSEALELSLARLDTARCTLTFRTLKRRKLVFRTVPIPEFLVLMLLTLPCDEDGRWWRMHRSTAWRLVKRCMMYAQIHGPNATCKGLRHSFGMKAAERSIPPGLIQKWMGHATLATTLIYLDAAGAEERSFAARMWEISSDSARSASSTRSRSGLPVSARSAHRASCRSRE